MPVAMAVSLWLRRDPHVVPVRVDHSEVSPAPRSIVELLESPVVAENGVGCPREGRMHVVDLDHDLHTDTSGPLEVLGTEVVSRRERSVLLETMVTAPSLTGR